MSVVLAWRCCSAGTLVHTLRYTLQNSSTCMHTHDTASKQHNFYLGRWHEASSALMRAFLLLNAPYSLLQGRGNACVTDIQHVPSLQRSAASSGMVLCAHVSQKHEQEMGVCKRLGRRDISKSQQGCAVSFCDAAAARPSQLHAMDVAGKVASAHTRSTHPTPCPLLTFPAAGGAHCAGAPVRQSVCSCVLPPGSCPFAAALTAQP